MLSTAYTTALLSYPLSTIKDGTFRNALQLERPHPFQGLASAVEFMVKSVGLEPTLTGPHPAVLTANTNP